MSSIRKILLTGTALVTVAVLSTRAYAANVTNDGTLTPDDTWAESASGPAGTPSRAQAGDTASLAGFELLVTNDQTANDGSADKNTFSLGVVNNNTAGAGSVNVAQAATGTTGNFSVSIAGITNGGGGANTLVISNKDAANKNTSVTIGASGLTLGGALSLTNNGLGSINETVGLTVDGISGVSGATTLQAGTGAGDAVSITNNGSAIYTGDIELGAGSAGAPTQPGADAVLNLNGANNQVGLVGLSDDGTAGVDGSGNIIAGQAILNFGAGTSTTTVTGSINGNAANEGVVNLLGSNTILGAIGTVHSIFGMTGGLAGTTSSISGAVNADIVGVDGANNGAAGSLAFGSTLSATTLIVESAPNATTAQAETATVAGSDTVSGITDVFASTHAGANATLTLNGAVNQLQGATNVTAATAGTTATINLNSATNTLGGLVTLTDSGTGSSQAVLNFGTGATTNTVTAGITGGGANEGTVNLLGANVINGAIGTTHAVHAVNAGVEGTTSSISGAVNAQTVTINGGTDAAATGATSFGSTLTVGTGGLTLSSAGATTAQVENATVTGVLTDSGALNVIAGAAAGASASATLNGASDTVSGAVNVTAGVGAGANASLTINATTGTIAGVTTLTDGGGNATLTLGNNSAITFTGGIVGAAAGEGTLALAGASTIGGQIGSATDALKSVTLAGGGHDVFNGSIYATTLAYGASNSTVEIADGANINGAITATNTGTLTLDGTSTVTGQVGAGGALVSTINAGAAAGKTDTFNNAVFATTLNVGAGSVDLKGSTTGNLVFGNASGTATLESGKALTGNINGTGGTTGAGVGNVILAGTNTITGQIGNTGILNAMTLNGSGVTDTVTSAGATVKAANTTTLGANTLAIGTNNFTLGAGQTLVSTVNSNAVYGKVTSSGTTTVAPTAKVNLDIVATGYLPTTTFVLASGGAGAGVSTLNAGGLTVNGVNDGAAQSITLGAITYTQVGGGTNQLEFQATNNGAASVATGTNNIAVSHALDTIAGTGNAGLQAVQANIANAQTAGAVNAVLSALEPTVDGGAQMTSMEVAGQVQNITDMRMAALRAEDGDGMTGMSSGASDNGVSMWVQGYGENETQSERQSIPGYSASTWGSAIGVDSENIIENGLLGLAFNYGKATINSDNSNTTNSDVGNYGLTLYGVKGLEDRMFLEGQLGYGYNKISSVRHDVGGVAGADATGDTNGDQYSARVTFGKDYDRWFLGDVTATPDVSASYIHQVTQGYTESGPGANLVVSGNSQNEFDLGFGGKLAWKLKNEDGSTLKPVVRADYAYAAVDDRIDTTASFAGAALGNSPTFTTEGPTPERQRLDFGVGIIYMSTANWDLSANYNFEYRPDYTANAGTLRLTAHF